MASCLPSEASCARDVLQLVECVDEGLRVVADVPYTRR